MKRVYIAGKLNAMAVDYLYNVHKMMTVAQEVKSAGYAVLIPAIDLLMGIMFGYTKYEEYFDNNAPWLAVSEAVLLVPGWETSEGTKREIAIAKENGVPVFESIEEMNKYFAPLDNGMITICQSWEELVH
jgi:hypothetical protein